MPRPDLGRVPETRIAKNCSHVVRRTAVSGIGPPCSWRYPNKRGASFPKPQFTPGVFVYDDGVHLRSLRRGNASSDMTSATGAIRSQLGTTVDMAMNAAKAAADA